MTIKELKEIAKSKGLKGYSKLRKAELEELLKEPTEQEKFLENINPEIEVIQYKDENDWLETRKLGLGGSDVAGVLGESKYKSAVDVWNDKINGSSFSGNRFTHWGNRLESVIATEFDDRHKDLKVFELNRTLKKGKSLANVDRLLYDPIKKEYGVLEIKTTNSFNYKEWNEETVPQEYYCQVMHYLAVTGLNFAYICCLIGGNDYKEFYIERNNDECNYVLNYCEEWWKKYIETNLAPPADGSKAYTEYQKKKADNLNDIEVELDIDTTEFDNLKAEIEEKSKKLELIKQTWIDEMIKSGAKKAKFKNHKITTVVQKRETLDKKKLKESIPNADDFFNVTESKFYKVS